MIRLLLLALLLPTAAIADEPPPVPPTPDLPELPPLPSAAPASPSAPAIELPKVELSGFVGFDWHQYLTTVKGAAPDTAVAVPTVSMVRFAPRIRASYRFVRAVAEVEFRHDFHDPGRGNRVILREAIVGLRSHGFRLEAGALMERWGKMDVNSPTDNLVSQDYEELFFPEALPVPGVLASYTRGPVSVQFVFVPAFVPARFRRESPSRWNNTWFLPQTQEVPAPIFGTLVFANEYNDFAEPVVPGGEEDLARTFEVGGRVDLYLPSVDLGLSFLATRDRLPTYTHFAVQNTADTDGNGFGQHIDETRADLLITPYHRRLLVPGLDLAVSAGPLVFKGEAAYFHTVDSDAVNCLVDDPYVKYAAGVELMLNNLVGEFDLALRFQYNGDLAVSSEEQRADQGAACPDQQFITQADPERSSVTDFESGFVATPEIRHPFDHAFYWNVFLGFTPEFSLDIRGFADIAGDALIRAKLAYVFAGALEAHVGVFTMLNTGEGTLFAPYANNHRIEAGLTYRF